MIEHPLVAQWRAEKAQWRNHSLALYGAVCGSLAVLAVLWLAIGIASGFVP